MNTVLYSLLESIRLIGIMTQPIMPYSSNKIFEKTLDTTYSVAWIDCFSSKDKLGCWHNSLMANLT